jgi:hypothetical protein
MLSLIAHGKNQDLLYRITENSREMQREIKAPAASEITKTDQKA